jgi:hypothetical protein
MREKAMRLTVGLLMIGVSTGALAAPPAGTTIVLTCQLAHTVPRDPRHAPPPPFTQHFRVNLDAKTVDGVRATVTSDKIGWEPRQSYLRPYATLSLPDWRFHASKWIGHVHDEVNGTCQAPG